MWREGMKKFLLALPVLLISTMLFAGTLTKNDGAYDSTDLTDEVNEQLTLIQDDLNSNAMVKLTGNQTEFAKANGEASASSIINGQLYSGVDSGIASVSFSGGGAVVDPTALFTLANEVEDGTDSYAGAAVTGFGANVLVNGDQFLPIKGFLFETKFSYFSAEDVFGTGLGYDSFLIGAGARYKAVSFPSQDQNFQIQPLTVGIGFYYSSSTMTFQSDPIESDQTDTADDGSTVRTETETTLDFELKNNSLVIPIEVVTSAKTVGFLNIIAGTGFDLVLGETVVDVTSDTTIDVYQNDTLQTPSTEPDLILTDSETKESPAVFRYKVIAGIGFAIGPARIEVPVAYYPTAGLAISAVAGATF
jgi:hypothetical protein